MMPLPYTVTFSPTDLLVHYAIGEHGLTLHEHWHRRKATAIRLSKRHALVRALQDAGWSENHIRLFHTLFAQVGQHLVRKEVA